MSVLLRIVWHGRALVIRQSSHESRVQDNVAVPRFIETLVNTVAIGLAAMLIFAFAVWPFVRPSCENCGHKLPLWRAPKNRQQLFFGGWTCRNCGCEVDARGRLRVSR
jgi:hypothetical protein